MIDDFPVRLKIAANTLMQQMTIKFGKKLWKDWKELLSDKDGDRINFADNEHFFPFANVRTESAFAHMRLVKNKINFP